MADIPNMTLLAWLVVGAIAGFFASEIMGTREGLVMMVVLGIVGAIVGGWIAADVLKIADVTGINLTSVLVAIGGAVVVIVVYDSVLGRRRLLSRR
ncbi:MAG: GlsB/YeaQ/YmgE family stress response membrane protein [Candidatus Limnocylindrales bacterium]